MRSRGQALDRAVLASLCNGQPALHKICRNPRDPRTKQSPGFFSQLNFVAQGIFEAVMRGERPTNASVVYRDTRLVGYGAGALGSYFVPYRCDSEDGSAGFSSLKELQRIGSRYQIFASLLRVLFTPLARPDAPTHSRRRFDLAIHVRRGDRIANVQSGHEWIRPWSVGEITDAATRMLSTVGANASVLVASDDAAFSRELDESLRSRGFRSYHLPPPPIGGKVAAGAVCDHACVPPLLDLIDLFARARRSTAGLNNASPLAVAASPCPCSRAQGWHHALEGLSVSVAPRLPLHPGCGGESMLLTHRQASSSTLSRTWVSSS